MLYSNQNYYLLRKPHKIASTFGQQQSILDYFNSDKELQRIITTKSDFNEYKNFCYIDGYTLNQDLTTFLQNQTSNFTKEQEYGLLNRLDNDTGGFLYFAKTQEIYEYHKKQQKIGKIQKMYLAQVHGNPFFKSDKDFFKIEKPIMHHIFDDQKMIVVATPADESKGRGSLHHVATSIKLLKYDELKNISLLEIMINKGIRHQIRIHCKSIGAPILGDSLYGPKPPLSDFLNLWSIGMKEKVKKKPKFKN